MYAIVKVGGKQYRVEKGDSLLVDRLPADEGAKLTLEPLLFRPDGTDEAVFEGDKLGKVRVEATVAGHIRGPKLHVLKFKPKRGYKRRQGHRSELTRLEIGDIRLGSAGARAKSGGAKVQTAGKRAEGGAGGGAGKRAAAKKPAASAPKKKEEKDGS